MLASGRNAPTAQTLLDGARQKGRLFEWDGMARSVDGLNEGRSPGNSLRDPNLWLLKTPEC
jgi:hypothetical protein